jgi:magnesium-transporting ATPase (P-type)
MSVVVEDSNGKISVLTKGADSTLSGKCDIGPITETGKHLQGFAMVWESIRIHLLK